MCNGPPLEFLVTLLCARVQRVRKLAFPLNPYFLSFSLCNHKEKISTLCRLGENKNVKQETEVCPRVGNTRASSSDGPWLTSRSADLLSKLRFLWFHSVPQNLVPCST
jgi:hypothetical protein